MFALGLAAPTLDLRDDQTGTDRDQPSCPRPDGAGRMPLDLLHRGSDTTPEHSIEAVPSLFGIYANLMTLLSR